ncbi:ATP-binding protein [Pimelobacter simplex]|uniref:ATP-binding protein n=1 Tax=Nocardioides simplex TaxID=2045 RepID=UPI003AAFD0E6
MDDHSATQLVDSLRKLGAEATGIEAKASRTRLPASAKESVVAFANSSRGGILALGVDESANFAACGVEDPGAIQAQVSAMLSDDIVPPIRAEVSLVTVDDATLVVVEVAPLPKEQKPAYVKARGHAGGAYIRVGESDRRLTSEEVQQLIAERGQPAFDREPVPGSSIDDLDPDMVARYVTRLRESSPGVFATAEPATILRMTNVVGADESGRTVLTLAGLMAMGRFPQQFFPQLNATLVVYPTEEPGTTGDGIRFLDNARFDGPIPLIAREVMAALRRNMRRSALVTDAGRRDIYDYPPEALREVVVNALVHRDFSPGARGAQVQIEMYPDRIKFKNPGGLFGSVDVTLLGEEGRSSARNAVLLRVLEDVSIPGEEGAVCENRGSGIRVVKAALRAAGMTPPLFKDSVTAFQVTMPNHALFDPDTVAWLSRIGQEQIKDGQATALALMARGEVLDNATYREVTTVQDSHTARVELQDLVARELVTQIGSRGGTKYVLSEYAIGMLHSDGRARRRPDRRRQIANLLHLHGRMSKSEISNLLGISAKTAEHWLRILKREGVVEAVDDGRGKRFTTYRVMGTEEDDPGQASLFDNLPPRL